MVARLASKWRLRHMYFNVCGQDVNVQLHVLLCVRRPDWWSSSIQNEEGISLAQGHYVYCSISLLIEHDGSRSVFVIVSARREFLEGTLAMIRDIRCTRAVVRVRSL